MVIRDIAEMTDVAASAKADGKVVGLVPTMGALHEGHLTLVKRARGKCDFVAVSIFVNPTQFLAGEDLDKYPRTFEDDLKACEAAGVDAVFVPAATDMYPAGYNSWVDVGGVTDMLEGAARPGHFRGVATVCTKLINIVRPDIAFFGRKDYQQLVVMKKLARELNMQVKIEPVEIVREPDGMAMSSRNRYLSAEDRLKAATISKSLFAAREAYTAGERDCAKLIETAEAVLASQPEIHIEYLVVADPDTLEPITQADDTGVVLIAARLGAVRLIDNILLGENQ